ncbi:MAG: flippase-like domain-containing protein, partial [bacterium]|nr:flippase-like domain-containing protein [bacterium]
MESVETAPKARKFISKRRLAYLLKLIIAAAVMIMLLKRVNVHELLTAFSSANMYCISVALILLVPNIYIQFYKWRYLVRLVKPGVSNRETFNSLLAGFTFGFITPGRLGEFGRAFFIKDCPWVQVLGMAFMDKLFSMAVVTFWGAIGLMYFVGKQLYIYTLAPIIIFTLITLVVIYYILLRPEIIRSFL